MKARKFYEEKGNLEKYHEIARKSKSRYRKRTGSDRYIRREWTQVEDEMVLNHAMPDRKLAEILKRSVTSIQIRRCRLKSNSV